MAPGCSQFGPQGHDWQDVCRVPLIILNKQALGLVVFRVEDVFLFFPSISLW